MARNTSVMGLYPDRTTVSDAVNVLHKEGYRTADISVLSSDNQGSKDFAHERRTKAPEGAATGAAVGAVVGRSSRLDRCWRLWLAPAPAGRWVGWLDCWRAWV